MTRNLNLRWPAEWEEHEATWIAWPHNEETWPKNLAAAQAEMERLIRVLAERESVRVLVGSKHRDQIVRRSIDRISNVEIWPVSTNDAWVRDYGPTMVENDTQIGFHAVDWQYNAWGDKYPPYDLDQSVARACAKRLGCQLRSVPFVLEGGAIEGNGERVLMTTESCLLHPKRNPGLTKSDFEGCFAECLSTRHVLWLPGGDIAGDDTDGHIDQIARFIRPDRVVISSERDRFDLNSATLTNNLNVLRQQSSMLDRPISIEEIPMPGVVERFSNRLPASYTNFIWANGAVIVPQYEDKRDDEALSILRDLLPEREIIGLPCRELIVGLGGWHCLTQQHCRAKTIRWAEA